MKTKYIVAFLICSGCAQAQSDIMINNYLRINENASGSLKSLQANDDGTLTVRKSGVQEHRAAWEIVPINDGPLGKIFVRIKKDKYRYLHTERGRLEVSRVNENWASAMWRVEWAGPTQTGKYYLRNNGKNSNYLRIYNDRVYADGKTGTLVEWLIPNYKGPSGVRQAAIPDGYRWVPNGAIKGHNTRSGVNGSPWRCAQLCTEEKDFICRSFDYHIKKERCDLSDKVAKAVGGLSTYKNNPYDHYERIKPTREKRLNTNNWVLSKNAAIKGHNTRPKVKASVEKCARLCEGERDFTCKSFDYDKKTGHCDLSNKSADEVGGLISASRYDHYKRRATQ